MGWEPCRSRCPCVACLPMDRQAAAAAATLVACLPSAHAAVIRAMRPIKAGEEITISYVDEDAPLEERQDALLEYGFVCDCPKCSAEGRH